jgi:hypothetical protein
MVGFVDVIYEAALTIYQLTRLIPSAMPRLLQYEDTNISWTT